MPSPVLAGSMVDASVCHGRLTLTSGSPIVTGSVSGASAVTVYFTPFRGNRLALFNGSDWVERTFSELSISLSGKAADTNYDVFVYDNAGTLTLELVAWSNSGGGTGARATALVLQNGIYVKTGETGKRYLGTMRTTGTIGQSEWSATKKLVWNYYNRVPAEVNVANHSDHNYNGANRLFNNSLTNNQIELVVGLNEDAAMVGHYCFLVAGADGQNAIVMIYQNGVAAGGQLNNGNTGHVMASQMAFGFPSLGWNYYNCYEFSSHASSYFNQMSIRVLIPM